MKGIEQLQEKGVSPEKIKILRMQFRSIKKDIKKFDFSKINWYKVYSWTEKEEDKFVEKLATWICKNMAEARKVFDGVSSNIGRCRKLAEIWVFCYGWRING